MKVHLAEESIPYTGRELRSHWLLETFGLVGDALVAFIGPCDVQNEAMVDLVDVAAGETIRARSMLHFIMERFDTDLARGVLHQRLLVALAADALRRLSSRTDIIREHDDIFVGDRKASVSIAAPSPTSTLIHLGVNVDPAGAPVKAVGLDQLGVDAPGFARDVMGAYCAEVESLVIARSKVRAVP